MPNPRKGLLQEVHQGLFGVEGSDDNGLVGDLKELKEAVKDANGRQRKTEKRLNTLIGVLVGLGVLSGGGFGISQLLT